MDLGVAASQGIVDLPVFGPLKVGVFSTGNELVQSGQPLAAGQIHDSNRPTLLALARNRGFEAIDLGWLPDDPAILTKALASSIDQVDVLLTTGGAAGGDADLLWHVLSQPMHHQGMALPTEAHAWKLKLRPGRPLVIGRIGQTPVFGLPGNPVAALLSFLFTNRIITITQFANAVSSVGVVAPVAYLLYIMLSPKTTKEERARLVYIIPMFIAASFTLLVNYQATTVLAIYAETNVNRNLFGFEITPAAYWTLNAFFAVIFGAVLTGIWGKLGKKQPSTPAKMGIGTALYGISILFMIIPFSLFPADVKVSPMWLVVFFAIMTIGEAIVTPAGESAASHVAPAAFSTQMMTVWAMGQSTGASLSSLVVNFYREGTESLYFLAIGAAVTLCGAIVVIFSKKLAKGMGIGTGHGDEQ